MVFNYKVRYKIWLTFILEVVPGEMLTFLDLKRFPCSDTALRDIHYSHYCKLTWSWLSTNIPHQRRGERVKSVTLASFVCSGWLLLLLQDSNHKNPPISISITVLYCTVLYCNTGPHCQGCSQLQRNITDRMFFLTRRPVKALKRFPEY